jgi:hypothetical protein
MQFSPGYPPPLRRLLQRLKGKLIFLCLPPNMLRGYLCHIAAIFTGNPTCYHIKLRSSPTLGTLVAFEVICLYGLWTWRIDNDTGEFGLHLLVGLWRLP